jgi:hypothetical protein
MPGRCARLCFTGIPVSISIAPTKTLAKVANYFRQNPATGWKYLSIS